VIVVPDAGPLIVVAGAGLTGAREVEGASWLQVEDVPVEPSLLATLDRVRSELTAAERLRTLH
jgi:hypothetical protein